MKTLQYKYTWWKCTSHFSRLSQVFAANTVMSDEHLIRYEADVCLCTLPLGVLKETLNNPEGSNAPTFEPQLPEWKLDAIRRLGFGTLNKVVLIFPHIFWNENGSLFGHVVENTIARGELFLFWTIYEKPVMIALVAGHAASMLEDKSDHVIVQRTMAVLRSIFSPNNTPKVIKRRCNIPLRVLVIET